MSTRSEKVQIALLEDLEQGNFPLNSRLPNESELCDRFKVSRNTVRKAIRHLADAKKVALKKNVGAFVISLPKEKVYLNTVSIMITHELGFLNNIQNLLLKNNYTPSFFFQHAHSWNHDYEEKFLQQVLQQRHKALLAFCAPEQEEKTSTLLKKLTLEGIRVIHMDVYKESLPKENYLMPDYQRAARLATTSLLVAGYENLYFCGYEGMGPVEPILLKSFLEVIGDQKGQKTAKTDIFNHNKGNYFTLREYGVSEIEENMAAFLQKLKKNSGIVCGTKNRAIKLMKLLQSKDIKVPEDIGIIGIEMLHEHEVNESRVDTITFARGNAFTSAIERVIQYEFETIKELIPPQMKYTGTVKKHKKRS